MLHPGDPELGNINAVPVLLLDEVSSDMSSINGAEVVVVVVLVTKVTGTGRRKLVLRISWNKLFCDANSKQMGIGQLRGHVEIKQIFVLSPSLQIF